MPGLKQVHFKVYIIKQKTVVGRKRTGKGIITIHEGGPAGKRGVLSAIVIFYQGFFSNKRKKRKHQFQPSLPILVSIFVLQFQN